MTDYTIDLRDIDFPDLGELEPLNEKVKELIRIQTDYGFECEHKGIYIFYPILLMN